MKQPYEGVGSIFIGGTVITDQLTGQVAVLIKGIGTGELGSNALMKSEKKYFRLA